MLRRRRALGFFEASAAFQLPIKYQLSGGSKINYGSGSRLHQIDPVSDPPTGDGGDRHEGQVHPAQAEEGPQLQADGRRRVKKSAKDEF